jgi:AraC-like DNA-binding protein
MLDVPADRPDDVPTIGGFGTASRIAPPCPLLALRQTTTDLPPGEQFNAWRDTNAGLVEYQTPATAPDAYEVTASTWRFGGLALMTAETPPGTYRRPAAFLRRDGIDLWSFSMATHGHRIYRTRDQITVMRPGQLALHSLAQPFDAARTGSGWLHLYLPRDEIPEAAAVASSGCLLLDTPGGRLLRDHLLLLARELPRMTAEDGARMAEATRAMIALALVPDPGRAEAAAAPVTAVQMVRLRGMMRAHLGEATLGPARLCRMANISRSQLYRLFEPYGGVALFIQRERLNAAHRALSDPADNRSISEIAESVGLFDPSSFSRMFRRSFGRSPRELRMARNAGSLGACHRGMVMEDPAGSFTDLLRAM